jgi:uncharacterized protein YutE (UPF0331/DUF86 family)
VAPPPFNVDVITRRLATIDEQLRVLEGHADVTEEALRGDIMLRSALERVMQVVVDLALDSNAHLATAAFGRVVETGRASFEILGEHGILNRELVDRLVASVGFRNALVHAYVDVSLAIEAAAVTELPEVYRKYVAAVARFVSKEG